MKNLITILFFALVTATQASSTPILDAMSFSDNQLVNLQNIINKWSGNDPHDPKPETSSRQWQTKEEIITALLKYDRLPDYIVGRPSFSFVTSRKVSNSAGVNAKIKINGFSAGTSITFSKATMATLVVDYSDPDIDYEKIEDAGQSTLYKNGALNQRVEESLSGKDKINFWKKRQMLFQCVIEAEINLTERGDLTAGAEFEGNTVGASVSGGRDKRINTRFITAQIPVPMGIADSITNRKKGTIITSFHPLVEICHKYISAKVSDLLDANLKADLATRVFQSDLTTCETDQDCLDANDHWFTQWLMKTQKKSFFCEEKTDLPGVKTCVKRGLLGSSCSNKVGSTACHPKLKCAIPKRNPIVGIGFPGYIPLTVDLGICVKP